MAFERWEDSFTLYNRLLEASSLEDARLLFASVARDLGFVAFTFLATDGRRTQSSPCHVTSLRQPFIDDYVAGQFWTRDPAVLWATRSRSSYVWSEAYRRYEDNEGGTKSWREVDDLAHSHGYWDGVIMPMRTASTSFSLALTSDRPLRRDIPRPAPWGMGLVGLAFDHWVTLDRMGTRGGLEGRVVLTDRERDVLLWLAEGKTSEDIGTILAISSKTVDFHVANLMRKMNALNRTQAVARAIRMGLI
jgi:DNA-binding CsgD family transcriptional regulator